ncbi:MAG: glycosyltransferase [Candidatus Neomarinimicrobiota bacterium]
MFLFGGSQGSAYLNRMINKVAEKISHSGIQLLWQTGDLEFQKYNHLESKNIRIVPFINNMADAYAISDLIVCRSGALTLAEITVCGKPSILIPFKFAAGDHQKKNAESLVNHNAAHILDEKTLTPKLLLYDIMNLIHNDDKLEKMGNSSSKLGRPFATSTIVDHILEKS